MKISVTEEDYTNGIQADTCSCMLALALQRQLKQTVSVCAACFRYVGGTSYYTLPPEAVEMRRAFDMGQPLPYALPFEFDIDLDSTTYTRGVN